MQTDNTTPLHAQPITVHPAVELPPVATPEKTIDQIIDGIAVKLLQTGTLHPTDRAFLNKIAATKLGLTDKIQSQFGKYKQINDLGHQILRYKMGQAQAAKRIQDFLTPGTRSDLEQKSLAELLLVYDRSLEGSYFHNKIAQIQTKKEAVTPQKLGEIIQKHNSNSPPNLKKAGMLAMEIGNFKVFYNKTGHLFVAPPERKVISAIKLSPANTNLDASRLESMRTEYRTVVRDTPYNNMGPMLDFMAHFRELMQANPAVTLKQAFNSFFPSPEQVYDKYHSGDCVILSAKIQANLQKLGVQAAVVGQYTIPDWAKPPVPDPSGSFTIWPDYDKRTENVHHCATAVRFQDQKGQEKGLVFETFTDEAQAKGEDIAEADWKATDRSLSYNKNDTPAHIETLGHILKMQMAGKTKVNIILFGPANKKLILGIDLMHGNLFLNTSGAEGLQGLPLNANGRFSMTLQTLRNPDQLGTYSINGQQVQITHREALTRFAAAAGERYRLPPDFVTNVLTLAECEEELVRTVLLSPAATAKETLQEAETSHRIVEQSSEQGRTYSKDKNSRGPNIATLIETYLEGQKEIKNKFQQLQQAILDNQPEVVRARAQEIRLKGDELIQLDTTIKREIIRHDSKHS
ncbi:MAG: hypothetical protein LLG04_00110 [Parachlamydia sp.]|nr:hypothetical protein [Parachlamydia sp.]